MCVMLFPSIFVGNFHIKLQIYPSRANDSSSMEIWLLKCSLCLSSDSPLFLVMSDTISRLTESLCAIVECVVDSSCPLGGLDCVGVFA